MVSLVIGQATADVMGHAARATVTVVCATTPRRHLTGRCGPRGLMDVYVEPLTDLGAGAVVLVGHGDLGLCRAARALTYDVLRLPDDPTAAAWVVSVGAALVRADRAALVRVLEVLCSGSDATPGPHRHWNGGVVSALRPATIARWATRNWSPCSWCRGGGLANAPCSACGALIAPVVEEAMA